MSAWACTLSVTLLALWSSVGGAQYGGQRFHKVYVPHISECGFCKQCVGDTPRRLLPEYSPDVILSPRLAKALFGVDDWDEPSVAELQDGPVTPISTAPSSAVTAEGRIGPQQSHGPTDAGHLVAAESSKFTYMEKVDIRSNLQRCETCRGCKSQLDLWIDAGTQVNSTVSERDFVPSFGRSSTWLFRAPSEKARHGTGVAKVWCIPFKKREGIKVDKCDPRDYERIMTKVLAYNKLARDCGMADLVPASWVEHIRSRMPDTDYVIDLPGMFSDVAPGVSLRFLSRGSKKEEVLSIFQAMRSDDIIRAAVFDLLVGNCDRNAENIFVDDNGKITLIDNDMTLSGKCVANSISLPTTLLHSREKHAKKASLLDMLDYRCHAKGGSIGTSYPAPVHKCLAKLQEMTPEEIAGVYGFPGQKAAHFLKLRAQQMLSMGFEWTLYQSFPFGMIGAKCTPRHFEDHKPCCKFEARNGKLVCADPTWSPTPASSPAEAPAPGDC